MEGLAESFSKQSEQQGVKWNGQDLANSSMHGQCSQLLVLLLHLHLQASRSWRSSCLVTFQRGALLLSKIQK